MRPGLPERQSHDYEGHRTTILTASLNVLEGTLIAESRPRHRHQEFLRFLIRIEASSDSDLEIHLIHDNYGAHKHSGVKTWLSSGHVITRLPVLPGSTTSNAGLLKSPGKRIRRGTFRSVQHLIHAIQDYIRKVNQYKEASEKGD